MSFVSYLYLLFFPAVAIIYYAVPHKYRYLWLLICSYLFYMGWNAKYSILIFTSTLITYCSSLLIEKESNNLRKKVIVLICILLNIAILFYFKYFNFLIGELESILRFLSFGVTFRRLDLLLPVGISFYTFQAIGYTVDVYRGDINAEKNFFKYALFVSFFPQLVAGPIERSKNLLAQINLEKKLNYNNLQEGILLMLWGYFMKIVVADRLSLFVDSVYGAYEIFPFYYLIAATVFFAIQIYCDFNGYTTIARGSAKIMGFELMKNFNAPYFSTSVAEFWRNWHISLTSWFKDYLYIPLGGSKKGTARKYLNKIIVFGVSGLWHGASVNFVIWGLFNGLYQIIEEVMGKFITQKNKIKKSFTEIFKIVINFILIDFSWIFFRADSMDSSLSIIKRIFTAYSPEYFDFTTYCGLTKKTLILSIVVIIIVMIVDCSELMNISIINKYKKQNWFVRCVLISIFALSILIFGCYGNSFDSANFIYFQF